jgi:uroporphyrin-3 C-methyltransferase
MSEQISPPENAGPDNARPETPVLPVQPRPAHKTSVAGVIAHISITQLTLAVLVIIFLWQWLDGHRAISDMQQQLAKKIAEMDGSSKANQMLLTQSQDQARELFAKVATLESRYAESQNQRAALETLYNDLSVSRDETALAEVEQMLLIAAQQLQLSANVKAALIAMQSADARLQRMNRPAFNGLRKAISQDMDKLRALPSVDITGINFQLNNLITAVDQMPLAYQQRAADEKLLSGHPNEVVAQAVPPKSGEHLAGHPDETVWQKLLREIWQEVKQLVRIENTGKAEIPLLPPNQEFFLRENLKLRLLSARLALLSRDEDSFRQELKTAQLWTARYFDGKSNEGMRMSDGLKKLAASDISIELPDISSSLQAVRNYRLTRENEPKASFEGRPNEPKASFEGRPRSAR